MKATNAETVSLLQVAFRMELETVVNYLANSVFLDGIEAMEVKRALASDIPEELHHAQMLAERIKQLGGRVPGSLELEFDQKGMQPPQDPRDSSMIVAGVIEAERSAIDHYVSLIQATSESDPVTAELATKILAEEDAHRTLFEGFQTGSLIRNDWT